MNDERNQASERVTELQQRYKEARDAGRLPLTASYLSNGLQHLHDYHPDGCMPWTASWLGEQVLAVMDEALERRGKLDELTRISQEMGFYDEIPDDKETT